MNKELIERFFRRQCTAAEAKQVAAYLKANPSVLEEYLSMHEWESAADNNNMPEAFWDEVWQNIREKSKAKIIALRWKRMAAAASIILIAGSAYFYFSPKQGSTKSFAKTETQQEVLPQLQHKTIANNTKKLMRIVLEDSSVAEISPSSVVQYDIPFQNNRRDITLEGEAKFHVAKNKQKPFTVYAGDFATTALGTVFSVKKNMSANVISVKLFEGKVVIHATNDHVKGWKNDIYLSPGEQLNFNENTALLAVEKINGNKPGVVTKVIQQNNEPVNNTLSFSNAALPGVMKKLSAYYNVKISYDTLLIDTMNFTGTVSKNDSLEIILKAIGQMNDLDISKTGNEFIISKHQ